MKRKGKEKKRKAICHYFCLKLQPDKRVVGRGHQIHHKYTKEEASAIVHHCETLSEARRIHLQPKVDDTPYDEIAHRLRSKEIQIPNIE